MAGLTHWLPSIVLSLLGNSLMRSYIFRQSHCPFTEDVTLCLQFIPFNKYDKI